MVWEIPSRHVYAFGFTAAALSVEHCRVMAGLYVKERDWDSVRDRVVEANLFRQNREKSSVRLEREIRPRLVTMTDEQLELLAEAPEDEAKALALVSVFKRYVVIYDFCVLVLRSKLAIYDSELRPSDFENFVSDVEPSHPEIGELTKITLNKVQQVMIRILVEAGILSDTKSPSITVPMVPYRVIDCVVNDSPQLLQGFLMSDSEISSLVQP